MTLEENEIRFLNTEGKIGIGKIAQLYHRSPNTIQSIIGRSVNDKDILEIHNKVYNADIPDSQIEYFVDSTRAKLRNLKTHDRGVLDNFPMIFMIADQKGRLVSYSLFPKTKAEYAFNYLRSIVKANLKIGSVIHVDIYSIWLFKQLEDKGFKVCHKNKRTRDFPFYHQIEHLFSNIQKTIRRTEFAKSLNDEQSLRMVEGLILLYHANQQYFYMRFLEEVVKLKQTLKVTQ